MNLSSARSHWHHNSIARSFAAVALFVPFMLTTARADETPVSPSEPPAIPTEQVKPAEVTKLETAVRKDEMSIIRKFTPLPAQWPTVPLTKASQFFRDIERRANSTNPEFPVTIMDDDSINLRPTINSHNMRNRVYEILNDRGLTLRWNTKSDILDALGGLKGPSRREAVAIPIKPTDYQNSHNPTDVGIVQSQVCVVIPALADLDSRTLVERWIGRRSGPNLMTAKQDPGPYAMMLRAVWHETWHCLDNEFKKNYVIEGDSAIDNAYRMHKAEVFAEVAALLTLAPQYRNLPEQIADIRAINTYWGGRDSMRGTRPTDEAYYEGVVYYLTKALDLVDLHVREMGPEIVLRYTMEDIRYIALRITAQGALSKEEFRQMATSIASGAAPSERTRLARERMLHDTGQPVPPKRREDEDHYDVVDRLRDTPAAEKEAITNLVKEHADAAISRGQRAEQGVVELIEKWRSELHGADRKPEIERKLYLLSMMLSYGELESEMQRVTRHPIVTLIKEKAEVAVPPPEDAKLKPEEEKSEAVTVKSLPQEVKAEPLKPVEEPLKEITSVEIKPTDTVQPVEVVPPMKLELNLNLNLQFQLKLN